MAQGKNGKTRDARKEPETRFEMERAVLVKEYGADDDKLINTWFLTDERARGMYAALGDLFAGEMVGDGEQAGCE
jgi:hypothetical protein